MGGSTFLLDHMSDVVDPAKQVRHIEQDRDLWALFLYWEEEYCGESGALDSGTHLLFALERR